MEITIDSQEKSAALSRTMVHATVTFGTESTPSRAAVRDAIAKKMKAEPLQVVVRGFDTKFGSSFAKITAAVYDSADLVAKYETAPMANRSNPKPKVAPAA